MIGQCSFVGTVKTPSSVGNHPQGTPKFTQLDYIDQRVNTCLWARATHGPTVGLYCTVGGNPLTTVTTQKTYLQRALLYHYSKKSSYIKSAENMHLILKPKYQMLSLISQSKNNRFI